MNGISLLAINAHAGSPEVGSHSATAPATTQAALGMSWPEVAGRIENRNPPLKAEGIQGGGASRQVDRVTQLAELLKVQTELNRHQLRVEFLSKISESALATIRKLQQN